MITGITIENFKGIRDPVKLDFRPITLLFGANSAGKSTILHALHYAREVFERHNLDADQTIAGGKHIDLGGYSHFIHRHDPATTFSSERRIRIRVNLAVTEKSFSNVDADINALIRSAIEDVDRHDERVDFEAVRDLAYLDFHSMIHNVQSAAVEIAIGWSHVEASPIVASTTIYFNDAILAEIVGNPNVRGAAVKFSRSVPDPNNADAEIEITTLDHPCLKRAKDALQDFDGDEHPYADKSLLEVALSRCGELLSPDGDRIELSGKVDALPPLDGLLQFELEPFSPTGERTHDANLAFKINLANELVAALSDFIIGPCRVARDNLTAFRYLGPLRDTPPRHFHPPRFPDASRWSSGLGAWDALYNGSDEFVEAVGSWLSDPDCLNAGCRIERRTFLELDYADPMVRGLMARRAFDDIDEHVGSHLAAAPTTSRIVVVPNHSEIELCPHDVGIGISQVVPVIVTALDGQERLLAIEQPELHIHPRLQAAIGDLFIETVAKNKHRFIIETHSEHLILRLLRRVRETETGKAPANRQLRTDDLAIYYLEQQGGMSRERRIDVDVKGEFIQPWPDDFFEIDFFERFG